MKWESWEIKGHVLEYNDDLHQYVCDGIIVPSITQILHHKFPLKYDGIPKYILDNAARIGTMLHNTIEEAEKTGDALHYTVPAERKEIVPEFVNYLLMKRQYGFQCLENEVPIILPYNGDIIAAGRLDMVHQNRNGALGLADIKRTSKLDDTYLAYQLTLYSIGYQYSYDKTVEELRCIWLREAEKKYKEIPFIYDEVEELLGGIAYGTYGETEQAGTDH